MPRFPRLPAYLLALTAPACLQAAAPAPATPAVSPVTRDGVNAGVLTCARRLNDLVAYLARDVETGHLLFTDPAAADRHAASLSLELAGTDQAAYVSATLSPTAGGTCDAVYDAVIWWPESCNDVASRHFAGLPSAAPLRARIRTLDGGANLKVFLLPAGTGCVSIKKEVVR